METFYGQAGEDVALARLLNSAPFDFYIDVGAFDPEKLSNTKIFYDRGWSGINIEPHPESFKRIAAARTRDINLNIGVADAPGALDFYCLEPPELSTFNRVDAERVSPGGRLPIDCAHAIEVRTLQQVFAAYVQRPVGFLSIDTEGLEAKVIAGNDWTRYRPYVVVVEFACSGRTTTKEWEPVLHRWGYRLIDVIGCNRFYIDSCASGR